MLEKTQELMRGNWTKTLFLLSVIATVLIATTMVKTSLINKTSHQKVAFQITSPDSKVWGSLLNNIRNTNAAFKGDVSIEVVAHGNGIALLQKGNPLENDVQKLANIGVKFIGCKNTLARKGISSDTLLPFVSIADSGIAHLILRNKEGWAVLHITD